MLKNVMFDLGGVMARFGWDEIFPNFFNAEDVPLARSVILRRWRELDGGGIEYGSYADESAALLPERLQAQVARFFREWFTAMKPIEDMWALAARLKARGYRVWLLSNATTEFAARAPEVFPILNLFDGTLFSANIQMLKPDAEIYLFALRHFGIEAGETLFVDDMPENAEGARRCGLHGFHFTGDASALLHDIEALSSAE